MFTPKRNSVTSNSSSSQLSDLYDRSNSQKSYYEQLFEKPIKIGEGSFGDVFQVQSREDRQLYAVKKIKYSHKGVNYRHEKLQEVRRLEEFSDHEHCVSLYKAWEQCDVLYLQMELCEKSLESYVSERERVREPMIWSILVDLLLVSVDSSVFLISLA